MFCFPPFPDDQEAQTEQLEPAVNPPCWGSETAVSLNLTIPRSAPTGWSLVVCRLAPDSASYCSLHRRATRARVAHQIETSTETPLALRRRIVPG